MTKPPTPLKPLATLAATLAAELAATHGRNVVAAADAQLRYARELKNPDYLQLCEEVRAIVGRDHAGGE